MRLALLLSLLLFASPALAGPAVAAIAAYFAVTTTTVIIVGQIVLTVALSVYGSAQQRRAARQASENARNSYNNSLQDRLSTVLSAEAPLVYVYGRCKVGSAITAMFTSGAKDEFKHVIAVHAAHECDGIEEIFVNGKSMGVLDGSGNSTTGAYANLSTERNTALFTHAETKTGPAFTVAHVPIAGTFQAWSEVQNGVQPYNSSIVRTLHPATVVGANVTLNDGFSGSVAVNYQWYKVNSRARAISHLGAPGQVADATLMAEVGAKWPSTATLSGLCYTYLRLDLNQPEFQDGAPRVEVIMRGKKLYDPRTGLSVWSQNNALVAYDYLISEMCGVPSSDLPVAKYITAANVCDESQSFGNRYTFNGTITADQQQQGVLNDIARSMAGSLVSTTWDIYAGKYVAPVAAFSQSDIIGSLDIVPGISDGDAYNSVRGRYAGLETLYVPTDFKAFQNSTYVSIDGGEQWLPQDYPYTDTIQRIWNLARIAMEDQRDAFTIKAQFSQKAWPRKIGERITFDSPFLGQVAKVYRITDKKYGNGQPIELTLKEDAAAIWDFADSIVAEAAPNTDFPDPFIIDKIQNVALESGDNALLILSDGTVVSRIHVTWDAATSQSVANNGLVEIEWYLANSFIPHKTTVSGSEVDAYLSPVEDGQFYEVRVRAVNPYLNVKSDWTHAPLHTVIGKLEPPPSIFSMSIDGVTLSWDEVFANDLAGYIFRYQYGTNTVWETAIPLYKGIISESPYTLDTLPFGAVTIMGKAVDTSGNESLITANVFTDLGAPGVRNIFSIIDFDPLYPGTLSGCSIIGGDVVATALDSFYGTDGQPLYAGTDPDSFYEPGTYGQMIYTTAEFELPAGTDGSLVTLDITTQGNDVVIEYRYVAPGSFYTDDTASWYDLDVDPFYPAVPGPWLPWPGQIATTLDLFQMRVTIGAGLPQGKIMTMRLVVDAPTLEEEVTNLAISAGGTLIPYTKTFTVIKSIQATLQANASGAETVETDKSTALSPSIKAFNSAHVSVGGASADITLKGY